MILSAKARYGIRLVLWLASQPEGTCISTAQAAQELGLSESLLAKVVQDLAHLGILHSERGRRGGIGLAVDPEEITLCDIVQATDPSWNLHRCVLGLDQCSEGHPCAAHAEWVGVRAQMQKVLSEITVSDFVQQANQIRGWRF